MPRVAADPLMLRCYAAAMPMIRHYLFVSGHPDAAAALGGVQYQDIEAMWANFRERSAAGEISEADAKRWMDSVASGDELERPGFLPSAALKSGEES